MADPSSPEATLPSSHADLLRRVIVNGTARSTTGRRRPALPSTLASHHQVDGEAAVGPRPSEGRFTHPIASARGFPPRQRIGDSNGRFPTRKRFSPLEGTSRTWVPQGAFSQHHTVPSIIAWVAPPPDGTQVCATAACPPPAFLAEASFGFSTLTVHGGGVNGTASKRSTKWATSTSGLSMGSRSTRVHNNSVPSPE